MTTKETTAPTDFELLMAEFEACNKAHLKMDCAERSVAYAACNLADTNSDFDLRRVRTAVEEYRAAEREWRVLNDAIIARKVVSQ